MKQSWEEMWLNGNREDGTKLVWSYFYGESEVVA